MNFSELQKASRQVLRFLWRMNPFRAEYGDYFNTPVKFRTRDWYVNERIVELPFVHNQIPLDGYCRRALDFGCTRSPLALQLAALGYEVVGIDLRPYPFTHPNLTVYQGNVLEISDEHKFDVITAVSVVEHIGLGAYGENPDGEHLQRVIDKLSALLKVDGRLIVTTPVGQPHVDNFLRSFAPDEIKTLFKGADLELLTEKYYRRDRLRFWHPDTRQAMSSLSNDRTARGHTGVNGVGCYVWQKYRRQITQNERS